MKFTVQSVRSQGARLGLLTEVGHNGNKTIETPMCMLYTRGGSCPHLTVDMLKKVTDVPIVAQMPLTLLYEIEQNRKFGSYSKSSSPYQFGSNFKLDTNLVKLATACTDVIVQNQEVIAGFKQGMAEFASLDHQLVYTSVHDPGTNVPTGYNDKNSVGVWAKKGKIKVDVAEFIKIQEAVQPDWFQCLTDCDTNTETKQKRAVKSVERTLTFLDSVLERKRKSDKLKDASMFGSIVGGYSLRERERSAKETVARNVDGFTIDGFFQIGPNTENFDVLGIKDILAKIMSILPDDKPRLMSCVWRPDSVLYAVEMGIDIFDSSYPYVLTERGCAMVFEYDCTQNPESENKTTLKDGFYIDLNDKKYFDDFSPLLEGCPCYACQNFTKAYINHLLNTSEMLSYVLLMIHNCHHYFQFFSHVRRALQEDKFNELKNLIVKQLPVDVNKPL